MHIKISYFSFIHSIWKVLMDECSIFDVVSIAISLTQLIGIWYLNTMYCHRFYLQYAWIAAAKYESIGLQCNWLKHLVRTIANVRFVFFRFLSLSLFICLCNEKFCTRRFIAILFLQNHWSNVCTPLLTSLTRFRQSWCAISSICPDR